jgi:hypothetical protein
MSYRPTQDVHSKRSSRTVEKFSGVHYGMSKEKQPNEFAATCDLMMEDDKAVLRPGRRKNETTGYEQHVTSMFPIHIGGGSWVGSIVDGILQAQPAEDILAGVRAYYTWDEVRQTWTVDTLRTAKTWHELMTSRT